MIGSKVVLAFDGKAVKTGLAGLSGMFGRLGRQIAIGGARQVGAGMVDIWGKLLMVIPEAINETTAWAGELVDLSTQTGVATKDLMELSEAFRMTGMESVDAGRMIGTMRKNLFNASKDEGDAREALRTLGFGAQGPKSTDPVEQMKEIMDAMNRLKSTLKPGQLEDISTAIFGGKIGLKTLRIFEDYPAAMAKAARSLAGFQNISKDSLSVIDDLGDSMGRFSTIKKILTVDLLRGLMGDNGLRGATGMVDNFYSKMIGLGDSFRKLGETLRNTFTVFMETASGPGGIGKALGDVFRQLGKWLGEGMKEGMGGLPGMLFPGFGGGKSTSMTDPKLLDATYEQTNILERIYREGGQAVFS